MSRFAAITLALTLLCPAAASATGLDVISQERTVEGSASAIAGGENGNDGDSASAPGLGAFDEARHGDVSLSDAYCSGGGSQDSWILPHALRAEATHFSNASVWGNDGFATGSGSTYFEVEFELSEASDYTFEGFVEEFDSGNSYVDLTGPSGLVHDLAPPHNDTLLFSESGTLPPGVYTLRAASYGVSSGYPGYDDYSSGAFGLDFILAGATDAAAIAAPAPTAFPNPFRASTRLTLPDDSRLLRVFDAHGRLVRQLQGEGAVTWDGRSDAGGLVPTGVYFVRAEGSTADPVKLVRLR